MMVDDLKSTSQNESMSSKAALRTSINYNLLSTVLILESNMNKKASKSVIKNNGLKSTQKA